MPRIYVKFNELDNIGNQFSEISTRIDTINGKFRSTINRLDFDIKCRADISNTANQLYWQLDSQQKALKKYNQFITQAGERYRQLDEKGYENTIKTGSGSSYTSSGSSTNPSLGLMSLFPLLGTVLGFNDFSGKFKPSKLAKHAEKLLKNIPKARKLGRLKGAKSSAKWLVKNQFGFTKVGNVSTAKKIGTKFYNNLHNPKLKTSWKSQIDDMADDLVGKSGKGVAVASWLAVGLDTFDNFNKNREEQKTNGMSDARVIEETAVETATDMAMGAVFTAGAGVVLSTVLPFTAPTILATLAGGAIYSYVNGLVATNSGQPISEWMADWVSDGTELIVNKAGDAFSEAGKAIANWWPF